MCSARVWLAASLALTSLAGCGDDDPVPIEEIPDDTLLVELSGPEMDGVCNWGAAVARQKLPPGTMCGTIPITFSGCIRTPAECPASVGEWKLCIPNLFDRFAADPCEVLNLSFSPGDLAMFIEETPSCMGLGACGSVMR